MNDADHALLRVFLAVRSGLVALNIKTWSFQTGFIRTTLVEDVHHPILSMFTAVHCPSEALKIEARSLAAGVVRALLHESRILLG